MRRRVTKRQLGVLIGTVLLVGAWMTLPQPAEAGEVSISLGAGFVVGGAHFRVAYATGGYLPFYYRVDGPLHHRGHACTDHCYVRRGHVFHAPFCPVVQFHFSSFRYDGPHYRQHPAWYGGLYSTRGHHRGAFYDHGRGRRHSHGWAHGHSRYDSHRHYRGLSRKDHHRRDRGHSRGYRGRESERHRRHDWDDRRKRDKRRRRDGSRAPGSARRTRP